MLFLQGRFGLGRRGVVIRAADTERIHPVLEHSTADPELGRRMGLHVIVLLQCIENDFSFEFHDRLFEREPACQGVVPQRRRTGVIAEDRRQMVTSSLTQR